MNSQLPDDSDSSDEDFIPDEKSQESVSELDSDENLIDEQNVQTRKRTKHMSKSRKKKKSMECEYETSSMNESNQLKQDEKKKSEEDVWADFMKDTGFQSRHDRSANIINSKPKSETKTDCKPKEQSVNTVTVKEVLHFAGEDITVEKQVTTDASKATLSNQLPVSKFTKPGRSKRSQMSGVSGILSQLGKKTKITTLEKSKLDWDQFKKEENLEEELQTYNKGKNGYLERQDFLNRADLRRFEIEKEIRTIERNKRVNNTSS